MHIRPEQFRIIVCRNSMVKHARRSRIIRKCSQKVWVGKGILPTDPDLLNPAPAFSWQPRGPGLPRPRPKTEMIVRSGWQVRQIADWRKERVSRERRRDQVQIHPERFRIGLGRNRSIFTNGGVR